MGRRQEVHATLQPPRPHEGAERRLEIPVPAKVELGRIVPGGAQNQLLEPPIAKIDPLEDDASLAARASPKPLGSARTASTANGQFITTVGSGTRCHCDSVSAIESLTVTTLCAERMSQCSSQKRIPRNCREDPANCAENSSCAS